MVIAVIADAGIAPTAKRIDGIWLAQLAGMIFLLAFSFLSVFPTFAEVTYVGYSPLPLSLDYYCTVSTLEEQTTQRRRKQTPAFSWGYTVGAYNESDAVRRADLIFKNDIASSQPLRRLMRRTVQQLRYVIDCKAGSTLLSP